MSCLNYNHVVLAGRVAEDLELKSTSSGIAVTSFDIAVSRNAKKDEKQITDFITVVAWRGLAEFVTKYFHKGSAIFVTGSLQIRNWEDKNGVKRSKPEIVADDIKFIDSKKSDNNGSSSSVIDEFEDLSFEPPFGN